MPIGVLIPHVHMFDRFVRAPHSAGGRTGQQIFVYIGPHAKFPNPRTNFQKWNPNTFVTKEPMHNFSILQEPVLKE